MSAENFIIKSPISSAYPNISVGQLVYDFLQENRHKLKPALVDGVSKKQYAYKEILGLSCRLAKALRANNYGSDSIVSICSENNINFPIPFFASMFIGATVSPINPTYTKHELKHCLNITKSSLIICSSSVCEKIIELKNELEFVQNVIVIDSDAPVEGALTMREFINESLDDKELCYNVELAEIGDVAQKCACICYSSGTTGMPKGVMLSHLNIVATYFNIIEPTFKLLHSENVLSHLPFFHMFGFSFLLVYFLQESTQIILKKFEPKLFLNMVSEYKIKSLILVPPIIVFLSKHPMVDNYDLSHVKDIICGAAPLDKETEQQLCLRLKNVKVRQGYGLSETTLCISLIPVNSKDDKFGSAGVLMPNGQVKILDIETGCLLGPNQRGELCFKGPTTMLGYFDNDEATKKTISSDGWLMTGDVAYYDEDKYLYIVDRVKELIKYNGFQIAPAELEGILLQHEEIADAAVVGVPRDVVGEVPVAFVEKKKDSKLTENEVKKFIEKHVSHHKYLRGGVIFVEKVPRVASGKVLRKEVRRILQSENLLPH